LSDLTLLQMGTDFTVAGSLSAICYGTATFLGVSTGTAIAGPVAGVVMGGLASAFVGPRCYKWTRDKTIEQFYARSMDPTAEMAGHLTGGIAGGIVGGHYGIKVGEALRWRWLYPNYATYEAKARALTEQNYNANRQTIDPKSMRGPANHLDHETSVRNGYEMHIPPAEIAAPKNLRIIPAPQNLSEGARLSPAVMRPAVSTLTDEAPMVRPAICVWGVLDWTRWCGGAVVQ
jgi:hypothetical protein